MSKGLKWDYPFGSLSTPMIKSSQSSGPDCPGSNVCELGQVTNLSKPLKKKVCKMGHIKMGCVRTN